MKVDISDFYCTKCGKKGIMIPRKMGQGREAGHLKRLYCLTCNEEVNHVEVRPYGAYNLEDFLLEFENNNFDKEGNRIEPWKQFCSRIRKEMDDEI